MQDLLKRLEALSAAYKGQFDNPPSLSLSWGQAPDGGLTLDGLWLCPARYVEPKGETVSPECLTLALTDGFLDIFVDWPYRGPARIASVTHSLADREGAAV